MSKCFTILLMLVILVPISLEARNRSRSQYQKPTIYNHVYHPSIINTKRTNHKRPLSYDAKRKTIDRLSTELKTTFDSSQRDKYKLEQENKREKDLRVKAENMLEQKNKELAGLHNTIEVQAKQLHSQTELVNKYETAILGLNQEREQLVVLNNEEKKQIGDYENYIRSLEAKNEELQYRALFAQQERDRLLKQEQAESVQLYQQAEDKNKNLAKIEAELNNIKNRDALGNDQAIHEVMQLKEEMSHIKSFLQQNHNLSKTSQNNSVHRKQDSFVSQS